MQQFFTALLGPMFAKEMIEISRRRWYFFNRVLYGCVLLCAMFIVWESNSYVFNNNFNFSIYHAARIASELFISVACVQYGAVFLFVPVFVAGVIANERETHSLDLLLTTQLTDREIVIGKLGSRLAVTGLLVLCSLPVVSLIGLFGGVDPGAVLRMQAATLLAMLYCGAHAVYFSTTTRSPMGALVRTYWWMALWILAVPFLTGMTVFGLFRASSTVERIVLPVLMAINPGAPIVVATIPEAHRDLCNWIGPWYFPAMMVLPATWSVYLLVLAVKKLRQTPQSSGNRIGSLVGLATYRSPIAQTSDEISASPSDRIVRVRPPRTARWLGWFAIENPFWLRSRLARIYDRDAHIRRIQWAGWCLAGGFLLLIALAEGGNAWNDNDLAAAFVSPIWIGVAALTAIVSASGLVGDRRRGFFELALVTDLTPMEIVLGTIGAVWEHIKLGYYLAWTASLFFMLTGTASVPGTLASIVSATLNCWFLLIMGVLCSLSARNVSTSLVVTFLLPTLMIAGVPMAVIFRRDAGPVIWYTSAALLVAAAIWVRRSSSTAAIGTFLIAAHLALMCAATFWTNLYGSRDEYPVIVMNPAIMTVLPLYKHDFRRLPDPVYLHVMVWSALVISGAIGIALMVRRFDELVDRSSPHQADALQSSNAEVQPV